jgi:hypothetical protein
MIPSVGLKNVGSGMGVVIETKEVAMEPKEGGGKKGSTF